jgi:uncharacterized protein (DUF1778 family)
MELSEILKYQGIELGEDATVDDYKKAFDEKYIIKENALKDESIRTHFMGEATSNHAKELLRTAKENGIELSPEEKKLPIADLSRLVFAKNSEQWDSKVKELQSAKKPSEEINAIKEKYETLNSRLSEEVNAKKELQELLEKKESEFVTFKKDYEKNDILGKTWGGFETKLSDTADTLRKEGFKAHINNKYQIEFDEENKVLYPTVDGQRVKDETKHGNFLNLSQVLEKEAKEFNILKQADSGKFEKKEEKREFKPNLDKNGVVIAQRAKPMR